MPVIAQHREETPLGYLQGHCDEKILAWDVALTDREHQVFRLVPSCPLFRREDGIHEPLYPGGRHAQ